MKSRKMLSVLAAIAALAMVLAGLAACSGTGGGGGGTGGVSLGTPRWKTDSEGGYVVFQPSGTVEVDTSALRSGFSITADGSAATITGAGVLGQKLYVNFSVGDTTLAEGTVIKVSYDGTGGLEAFTDRTAIYDSSL